MGRRAKQERTQVLIRMRPEVLAESILLNPQMQDYSGGLRYGALSEYFNRLVMEDNARRRNILRAAAKQQERINEA